MGAIIGVLAFVLGLAFGRVWRRAPSADGLPCPNTPCRNVLPRRGMWSHTQGGWAVEECSVCGCSVQYRSWTVKSHVLNENDCYVRVVPAMPKAEAP